VQVDEKTARMEAARAGWMKYMVCLWRRRTDVVTCKWMRNRNLWMRWMLHVQVGG
jgi:hypothetical protein